MKKTNTLAACGVLSVAMAASVLTGCGDKAVDGTQTAMVIDGDEITLGTANYLLRTEQATTYVQMSSMMSYLGGDESTFWSTEVEDGVTYGDSLKDSTVTELTQLVEIRKHAEDLGVSITDEENTSIEEAASAFMEKNSDAMKTLGVSQENVEEMLQMQTLQTKIRPVIIADVDTDVSDDEAAQTTCTYIRLKKSDDEEEAATQKEQMEEILKQVLDASEDADLSEIAEAVNEDCYSTQYNFDKGAYDDDSNVLDSAVKDVLQDLKDHEVYDQVIEGDDYYFIIRMDNIFDRDATDTQKETIVSDRESDLYNTTIEGWTDGIEPETEKCWDEVAVDDSVIYTTTDAETTE